MFKVPDKLLRALFTNIHRWEGINSVFADQELNEFNYIIMILTVCLHLDILSYFHFNFDSHKRGCSRWVSKFLYPKLTEETMETLSLTNLSQSYHWFLTKVEPQNK